MPTLRRDAARNRARILDAARALRVEGAAPQLNAVARMAEVGVGTVYRHFATPEALLESLVEDRFAQLTALARDSAATDEPGAGLRTFLRQALAVLVADPAFAEASVNPSPAQPRTRALRSELIDAVRGVVGRAARLLRPGLDGADVLVLLCGLAHAVRLRPDRADAYLDAVLDGLLVAG